MPLEGTPLFEGDGHRLADCNAAQHARLGTVDLAIARRLPFVAHCPLGFCSKSHSSRVYYRPGGGKGRPQERLLRIVAAEDTPSCS